MGRREGGIMLRIGGIGNEGSGRMTVGEGRDRCLREGVEGRRRRWYVPAHVCEHLDKSDT